MSTEHAASLHVHDRGHAACPLCLAGALPPRRRAASAAPCMPSGRAGRPGTSRGCRAQRKLASGPRGLPARFAVAKQLLQQCCRGCAQRRPHALPTTPRPNPSMICMRIASGPKPPAPLDCGGRRGCGRGGVLPARGAAGRAAWQRPDSARALSFRPQHRGRITYFLRLDLSLASGSPLPPSTPCSLITMLCFCDTPRAHTTARPGTTTLWGQLRQAHARCAAGRCGAG